ncbi:MAG: hypothetical protein J7K90_09765 [Desulfuromusa sp.]|nr:hypothetical protein [Desulfuromusa sp.]
MLWNRLSALYGKQWENNSGLVGGETYLAWESALLTYTEAQVIRGYDSLLAENSDYAPNLIKFMRLCRTPPDSSHRTIDKALPKPKPRYSVMRIETMKQRALTGKPFEHIKPRDQYIMDWDRDDEKMLMSLLAQWDENTGLNGLNALIDGVDFSHGKQEDNAYVDSY